MLLKDPLTGQEFEAKRTNQRFASAFNRIKYHNEKSTERRRRIAFADKPLHRNYNILVALMDGVAKEQSFSKDFLLGKGYDYGVCTHLERKNGKDYFALYEFYLETIGNGYIKVTRI